MNGSRKCAVCVCVYICNEMLFGLKKKKEKKSCLREITWMTLEGTVLSEMRQTQKDKYCIILHTRRIFKKKKKERKKLNSIIMSRIVVTRAWGTGRDGRFKKNSQKMFPPLTPITFPPYRRQTKQKVIEFHQILFVRLQGKAVLTFLLKLEQFSLAFITGFHALIKILKCK